jgi:hypothetical protein
VKWLDRTSEILVILILIPSTAGAQAWVFPKGGGTVTASYQSVFVRDHVDGNGTKYDLGHIISHVFGVDTDYSLTDRLAVKVGMPYVAARYYGPYPHQSPIDDGHYHSAAQDFTFDVRYNVANRKIVFTPFLRTTLPSHSYAYFGHAAVGHDQREFRVGANLGRRLDPILPKAYVQGQYGFGFQQRVLNIAPKRSYVEAQFGYFLSPRVTVLSSGQWLHTHNGGIADFKPLINGDPYGGLPPEVWPHHDQIGKFTLFDLSGGAAFTLSPSTDVFVSIGRSLHGTTGHLNSSIVTIGVSRSFGTKFTTERAISQNGPSPAPDSAFVCTCAKIN